MIPLTHSLRRGLLALLVAVSLPLHAEDTAAAADDSSSETAEVAAAVPTTFPDILHALGAASLSERSALLEALLAAKHPNTAAVLGAWLEDHLHVRDADGAVFITAEADSNFTLIDPLTLAEAGSEPAEGFSKIGSNNSLRKLLRSAVASFKLGNPDSKVRLAAVQEMLRAPDETSLSLLREHAKSEQDAAVLKAIAAGQAYADLTSDNADTRLAAVDVLSGALDGETLAKLEALREECTKHQAVPSCR